MRNFVPTNLHDTVFAPKQWLSQKEATCMGSSKMYCPDRCRKRTYKCGAVKYPISRGAAYGREWKYVELRAYQSPWYSVCSKAMVISKGSYAYSELKNAFHSSGQKTYLTVRGRKVPRFMRGNIGPRMEIFETSCLPIPMVPHLHQSNGYIKRKLRVWIAQKCIPTVGAENVLTSAGT